jgi:hypothetical protein
MVRIKMYSLYFFLEQIDFVIISGEYPSFRLSRR